MGSQSGTEGRSGDVADSLAVERTVEVRGWAIRVMSCWEGMADIRVMSCWEGMADIRVMSCWEGMADKGGCFVSGRRDLHRDAGTPAATECSGGAPDGIFSCLSGW